MRTTISMTKCKMGTNHLKSFKLIKKLNQGRYSAAFYLLLITIVVSSCNNTGDVGMDLLPATDLINVVSTVDKNSVTAYPFRDDSLRTDESSSSLLGTLNDPVFGRTSIDLGLQFRLGRFPRFGTNPVADSVIFYFYYRTIYGDTASVQKLEVYELEETLDPDASYYDDVDLSQYASSFKLAEYNFQPKVKLDSIYRDTVYQLIGIKLDKSLANKLITADSLDLINNDVFLQYFKGLYVKSASAQGKGAIVTLNLLETSTLQGSALVLYYHNNTDTTNLAFYVTEFSARVNSIKHDYSQAPFFSGLNQETRNDSLIYIQSTGGIQSKIYFPSLDSWKDSTSIAINKAEVIFKVDTLASDFRKYPLPFQLFLTYLDDKGNEYLPKDYSFNPTYYGGFLYSDYTYRFNITQHMQSIIKGETGNNGFYLTTSNKNSEMKRAVLKGGTSAAGIKIAVTYSKFLQ